MVTTIEIQSHNEPEYRGLSRCHSTKSSKASSSMRDPSPTPSNTSSTDLSVSSLVQIWKGLEAQNNQSLCESTSLATEENIQRDLSPSHQCTINHVDQQQQRQQHNMQENEIRVANMVRTWANTNQVTFDESCQEESSTRVWLTTTIMNIKEQKSISSPIGSHKLRGRQAIVDLYMRMERNRHMEIESLASRKMVTKFSQRGRIQSLQRFKLLRGPEFMHKAQQSTSHSKSSGLNKKSQLMATSKSIREGSCATPNNESANILKKAIINGNQEVEDVGTSNQNCAQTSNQEEINTIFPNSSDDFKGKQCEESILSNQEELNKVFPITSDDLKGNQCEKYIPSNQVFEEHSNTQLEEHRLDLVENNSSHENLGNHGEQNNNASLYDQGKELTCDENENVDVNVIYVESLTIPCNNLKEEEDINGEHQLEDKQHYFGLNLDWIVDIARPRTYWEDQRQARYEEIYNMDSKDKEIMQLIERGNVSSLLASDFRDIMDRLMICSLQKVLQTPIINVEEGQPITNNIPEQHCENMLSLDSQDYENQGENLEYIDEINEEKDFSPRSQQYQDDVDNNSYQGSSLNNISQIEINLLCSLRVEMQQLHEEMFELRKSITSMPLKFQDTIKEEVSNAIRKLEQDKEVKNASNAGHEKKDNCCICYEKKIDSLLYRCGHMCTCLNCANELQRSTGKCPICQAQIVDVVQTFRDTQLK